MEVVRTWSMMGQALKLMTMGASWKHCIMSGFKLQGETETRSSHLSVSTRSYQSACREGGD